MRAALDKKLCVFGSFQDNELYPRNRTLITALSNVFDTTIEVRPAEISLRILSHGDVARLRRFLKYLWRYFAGLLALAKQAHIVRSAGTVFVPYPAYLDIFILKWIFLGRKRPKLIIDSFLCLYDTLINDRKMFQPGSFRARLVSQLERYTLNSADMIFIDTEQQRNSLLVAYGLSPEKIVVTPVGIDESVWMPLAPLPKIKEFILLFWGTFIPLHGVEVIVRAAEVIGQTHPEIKIKMIGDGQTADAVARHIASRDFNNLEWDRELVSGAELRINVEKSHCLLGIFGTSEKAGNVIPYKVYQAMASNKILITRDGPAMAGKFQLQQHSSGLFLVPPGDHQRLAKTIIDVYQNYDKYSRNVRTRELYEGNLSNAMLASGVAAAVEKLRIEG